jgi:Zn-dependent M28 family amino/carboxypeptidase
MRIAPLLIVLLASPALASPPDNDALLHRLAADVSPAALHDTDARLVAFGTRHTLSDTVSDTRGVGAARRYVASRFQAISAACGGCLTLDTPSQTFTGERLPKPAEIVDVLAIQKGTSDPGRVVIISGHIDSRVNDVMDAVKDAPGANDDGSGTSAVIEAARVLSKHKFPATIVYAVLQGEEQGLYGGRVLAAYAKAHGWRVEAQLNNDIIGNTHGIGGEHIDTFARVFSEGTRPGETPQETRARRLGGGEDDSPSRNLARFIAALTEHELPGFSLKMIYRADRFSRGGDQGPMQEAGYPAVRLTEATENYNRQHQDVRIENGLAYGDALDGVDFPYLAQVTRVNVAALAALASAPPPPTAVTITGAVSDDTTVSWSPAPGAATYRIWWRETSAPRWTSHKDAGAATTLKLDHVNIDDWVFGVSAISADGWESPVEFPGVVGAFERRTPADASKP